MEPYLVIFLVATLWITINILNLQQSSLNKYQLEQYFEKFYSCRVPFSFIVFSQITFLYITCQIRLAHDVHRFLIILCIYHLNPIENKK